VGKDDLVKGAATFTCTVRERNLRMDYDIERPIVIRRISKETAGQTLERLREAAKKLDGITGEGCIVKHFSGIVRFVGYESAPAPTSTSVVAPARQQAKSVEGKAEYKCFMLMQRDPGRSFTDTFKISVPARAGEKDSETMSRLHEAARAHLKQKVGGCSSKKLLNVRETK
jgi:hypothetical protein